MIAGKYLLVALGSGVLIGLFDDLGIVFDDIGKLVLGKNLLPEVVGLDAVRIRRIACTVTIALVEGQKPAFVALQLRTHPNLVVVHSKMHHAALEAKQKLRRAAICPVLLDSIPVVLLGQLVFQLHRDDGQTIQKDAYIQCQQRVELGILQLPCHAENVLFIQRRCVRIIRRRTDIKQIQMQVLITHSLSQQVDDAIGLQLLIQLLKEFGLFKVAVQDAQFFQLIRLRGLQKAKQPPLVHGIVLIVFRCVALFVTIVRRKPIHDQGFKAIFFGIRNCWQDYPSLDLLFFCGQRQLFGISG